MRVILRVQALWQPDAARLQVDTQLMAFPNCISMVTAEVRSTDTEEGLPWATLKVERAGFIQVEVVISHQMSLLEAYDISGQRGIALEEHQARANTIFFLAAWLLSGGKPEVRALPR